MTIPRIAINGFGRIGRTIMRIAKQRGHYDVVAVNDLATIDQLAYAFKYDSIHGTWPGDVKVDGNTMEISGDPFQVLCEKDPANLPWKELGIDYVVESSGVFRTVEALNKHLQAGAKRIILTVPCKDPIDAMLVTGVNDDVIKEDSQIISNASCTTNCAAPLCKVLHESFGIKRGLLTTVHAYTSSQRLIDSPHSDNRRSRNAATNIVPTSTGAAKAVGVVMPELAGKLDGMAMRVPVPDGSLVDLTVELETDVTVESINQAMAKAAQGSLKGILEYLEEDLVSSDIIGNTHSSIYDSKLTQVIDKRMAKIVSWYDNEWGYSTRVEELIGRLATMDGLSA
jgi:glyceraldehyde 3-phosphate dehydrogenase